MKIDGMYAIRTGRTNGECGRARLTGDNF